MLGWLQWMSSAWWLHTPLRDISGFSTTTAILIVCGGCLLMALPYAMAAGLVCRWPRPPGVLGSARNAALFTLAITFLTPVFKANLAHTQYRSPIILQVLELGGTPLLLFLMLWVNWLLADAWSGFQNRVTACRRNILAAVGVILFVTAYGWIRLRSWEHAIASAAPSQQFTIGAIQPNIPIPVPLARQPCPAAESNSLSTAFTQAANLARLHPGIDLLAFPENPELFEFNINSTRRQALAQLINQTHLPVLLNADAVNHADTNQPPARYNVAVLVDAAKNLTGHYRKIQRVPLIEYVPGESLLPWLRRLFPKTLRVLPGEQPEIFEVKPGIRIIPLVCYEATIPPFTRQFIRLGGNLIVNQANDTWFLRTPGAEFHFALSLFRCVEYRVPMVRVTNSGFSAHIQTTGQVVPGSRTQLFTRDAKAAALYVPPQRSVYSRIGDYWMLAFVLLLWRPSSSQARKSVDFIVD